MGQTSPCFDASKKKRLINMNHEIIKYMEDEI